MEKRYPRTAPTLRLRLGSLIAARPQLRTRQPSPPVLLMRRLEALVREIALMGLVLLSSGCVSYAQTSVAELAPTDRVRIELDDSELPRLLEYVDDRSRSVSGNFVREAGDSVVVVVRAPGAFAQVAIPAAAIVSVERGEVSAAKNIVGSLVIVGGVAVVAVAGFDGGGRDGPDPGDGTEEFRAGSLLFRLPLRLLGIGR